MAKAFSVLSWNVEHFGATDKKKKKFLKNPKPIIEKIAEQNADVVAIFEVRSDVVFRPLVQEMSNYHFFISEGPQMQEILVGVRKSIATFTTQKTEFKAGQSTLRPGMVVTPYVDEKFYPILFLHVKSMRDPKGFGLRYDMMKRAFDFRKVLKKAAKGGEPNYLIVGDLNTMGMDYYGSDKDVSGKREVSELGKAAQRRGMSLLGKTQANTYWHPKYGESDLDQVVAMEHLEFRSFGGKPVRVTGWPDEPTDDDKAAWVETFSDHALLYFEVQKV
ncbi:MAG: hypothetical protein QNJ30_14825 [Kiloniellales bacterium]|nr:hypothetical protein [Kiloniellales bacterium]